MTTPATNSDVRVRAVREDELDAFAASDDPRQAAWLRSYLAERIPAGKGRPEWCFVAERGGRVAGRLAYWAPRPDPTHLAVDILDLPWEGDWLGVGGPLLRHSLAALRARGAATAGCAVDTPSGWDPFRAQILALLARCGFVLRRETLCFEWRPPAAETRPGGREPEAPAQPAYRLAYRPLEEVGEAAFVAAIRTVLAGTLDRGHQRDLRRQGPERKAQGMFDAARGLVTGGGWRAGPGSWQLGYTPGGALAGLVIPVTNAAGAGVVWYIGVAPEQRGRRYVDDLLARLTAVLAAAGVPRIVADTDTKNTPMAAAFRRAGWTEFARSASYVLELTELAEESPAAGCGAGTAGT